MISAATTSATISKRDELELPSGGTLTRMDGPLACGESARVSENGRFSFLLFARSPSSWLDAEAGLGLGVALSELDATFGVALASVGATLGGTGGTLGTPGITLAGRGSGGVVASSRGGTTTGTGMPMSVALFERWRAPGSPLTTGG
jgi:hypothetical protein